MFKAISKIAPDAAFAIFTGDIVEHDIWETTREANELQSEYLGHDSRIVARFV